MVQTSKDAMELLKSQCGMMGIEYEDDESYENPGLALSSMIALKWLENTRGRDELRKRVEYLEGALNAEQIIHDGCDAELGKVKARLEEAREILDAARESYKLNHITITALERLAAVLGERTDGKGEGK
jgi:hypothetical protein